ncbi:galactose-specific lectin nattectin-like [Centropristis striata]|uniref:galactose-specific lectin nattectin-like n=1 Tax=Centropristis striata TaxID=184440 RepID=UPI0027E1B299|nr:galactose-specific lectin nattectin-like [Centropristis striata]
MADAERYCGYFGGNLASVHSLWEYNFLRHLMYQRFHRTVRFWIGLFDAIQERSWMWTDGSRVRFTYWSRGEPNNRRNEDCTEGNWKGRYWNDVRCHYRRPYVCARRI